jgi:hypothetical protein
MCVEAVLKSSPILLTPLAFRTSFVGFNVVEDGFDELYCIVAEDRQRNRAFFSGMLRGVSNAREGSKILSFLFRPRLVCSSLLHLLTAWTVDSANFALTEFS